MEGESNARTKQRNGESRPSPEERGKEGHWNQVEDRSIESWRARFIEEDHCPEQCNSSADEHGLVLPSYEFGHVHLTSGTVRHLDAGFEFLEHSIWIMRNLRVLLG